MISRRLSGDELADAQEQFDECDLDGDQRISYAEFTQLLDNLGAEIALEHRRARFEQIDQDRDGAIVRDEFLKWWAGRS